ncbi:MFS transporter [Amycolatopsis sp. NPDC049253]|uniref:MFS transporter n=1 Tax=Amycolatopsis sp. NPDC049253 TaxID=3155274 RepID=UPI003441505D
MVTAQLMVAVDAATLALAIPGTVADLPLSSGAPAWVMAGYVLAGGSLMIAAGRIAQAVVYTRVMSLGLVIFGVASAAGGAADTGWVLISARVAQGIGAAALTPAAMARLSAAFPAAGREKAYGRIMGSGTAIGLVLGGLLTQLASWRACLEVNVVFVLVALGFSIVAGDRVERSPGHGRGLGHPGAHGGGRTGQAAGFGLAGVTIIAAFAAGDRKSRAPLIPVALFRDPTRHVAYLGLLLWGVATITTFVAASRSLQQERFAPLVVGALFLVYRATIQLGLFVSRRAGTRPAASAIGVGLVFIAAGQITFAVAPDGLALPVALTGPHTTSLAAGVTAVALLARSVLALGQPRATTDRPPASRNEKVPTDPPR